MGGMGESEGEWEGWERVRMSGSGGRESGRDGREGEWEGWE